MAEATDPWSRSLALTPLNHPCSVVYFVLWIRNPEGLQNITLHAESSKLFNSFAFVTCYKVPVFKSSTDKCN